MCAVCAPQQQNNMPCMVRRRIPQRGLCLINAMSAKQLHYMHSHLFYRCVKTGNWQTRCTHGKLAAHMTNSSLYTCTKHNHIHTQRIPNLIKNGNFYYMYQICAQMCHKYGSVCGLIFDPRLIGTDSRRMDQICNSCIVQICTDHIYESAVLLWNAKLDKIISSSPQRS